VTDARITRLEDRVRELQIILGTDDSISDAYRSLGLSKTHCAVLGFLMKRDVAPREQIYTVLYGARPSNRQPDIKTIDAHICYIRRALTPIGVGIVTVFGSGWKMMPADKIKLKNWLAGITSATT
jgi:DNA-binding response OmpR family regulator